MRTDPCSPHPAPQGSAIPDSRRGEGCYGSPNRNLSQLNPPSRSTSLPPLPAAAPGCSSPAKQSHRKQRQFNTGKCLEQGRLGETSLSSSEEESRGTLYFTVSLSSSEEAGCGSQSQGCLSAVTSHLRGTESPRAGRDALRSQSCCCRRAFPKASHHQRAVEDDALLWLAAFPVFVIQ